MSKPASRNIQPRTVKAWCVVNAAGWPFPETTARRRRDSVGAYGDVFRADQSAYKSDHQKYGVQVVRCTITTEAKSHEDQGAVR